MIYQEFTLNGKNFVITDLEPVDVANRSLQTLQATVFPPHYLWSDLDWDKTIKREGLFLGLRVIHSNGVAELVGALICPIIIQPGGDNVYDYALQMIRPDYHKQGHTIRMSMVLIQLLDPEYAPRIITSTDRNHFLRGHIHDNLSPSEAKIPNDTMYRASFPTAKLIEVVLNHAETDPRRAIDNAIMKPRSKLKAHM